ncbi:hypothetical protein XALC_2950 [Xanthomonas albilineans GPE PC73]|uniref:DUF6630 domain-containing protein n=1 Tax=Xanthomonas albilineans (strain GPE PC73 / CFBP 7063) TaxID=380358 RepID=D2UGB6_XANAP|nr:hypothetical protein XALC_2950 [Xanthomonas albilineans GPE PC73]
MGGYVDDEDLSAGQDAVSLLTLADDRLRGYGDSVWCWDTGSEFRADWMARSRDDQEMQRLAAMLAIDLCPRSEPF